MFFVINMPANKFYIESKSLRGPKTCQHLKSKMSHCVSLPVCPVKEIHVVPDIRN